MIIYNRDDKILSNISKLLEKRFPSDAELEISVDFSMDEKTAVYEIGKITAGSHWKVLELAGRLLRNPNLAPGEYKTEKDVCGMYFASHNKNYYETAPLDEIYAYIDDLALWGMNTVKLWFDLYFFENMQDGAEYAKKLKAIFKHAKSIGIKVITTTIANEAFHNSPKELRADWTCGHDGYIYNLNDHYHVELCPSIPDGLEKILEYRKEFLETFKDVEFDYMEIVPYDEGGCTCKECAPWGINGFLKCCEALIPLYKSYYPNTKIIFTIWQFGTFTGTKAEFDGLKEIFAETAVGHNFSFDIYSNLSESRYVNIVMDMKRNLKELTMEELEKIVGYPFKIVEKKVKENPMNKYIAMTFAWNNMEDEV
jgi:hypothetical protein